MDPFVQVLEPKLKVRLVVFPCHAIYSRGSFALERIERQPERLDVDMVEKRGEPLLLPLPCGVVQKWPVLGNTDNKNPAARQGWF